MEPIKERVIPPLLFKEGWTRSGRGGGFEVYRGLDHPAPNGAPLLQNEEGGNTKYNSPPFLRRGAGAADGVVVRSASRAAPPRPCRGTPPQKRRGEIQKITPLLFK